MKTEFWKKNKNRLLFIAAATAVICLVTMLFYSPGMISAPFGTVISILTPFLVGLVIAYLLLPMTLIFERKLRKIGGKKAQTAAWPPFLGRLHNSRYFFRRDFVHFDYCVYPEIVVYYNHSQGTQ